MFLNSDRTSKYFELYTISKVPLKLFVLQKTIYILYILSKCTIAQNGIQEIPIKINFKSMKFPFISNDFNARSNEKKSIILKCSLYCFQEIEVNIETVNNCYIIFRNFGTFSPKIGLQTFYILQQTMWKTMFCVRMRDFKLRKLKREVQV